MRRLIAFFVHNVVIVNVMLITVFLLGYKLIQGFKKEDMPDIKTNLIQITATYPSGSIQDTELKITKVIEDQIKGIDGVDSFKSITGVGRSMIMVTLNVFGLEKYNALQTLRDRVAQAGRQFPSEASNPDIQELTTTDSPVIFYQIRAEGLSEIERHELAKEFQENLEAVSGVSEVDLSGDRDRQINIMFNSQKLKQQDVSISDLTTALTNYVIRESAGSVYSPNNNRNISIETRFTKASELANVNVRRNFTTTGDKVKDFSVIQDGFADREFYVRSNLEPAITVTVYKDQTADSVTVVRNVRKFADRYQRTLDLRYSKAPKFVLDQVNHLNSNLFFLTSSEFVKHKILNNYGHKVDIVPFRDSTIGTMLLLNITKNNAILGIVLVFLTLWVFLDFRIAIWTSLGIPFALVSVFIIVFFMGYTINNMMLFGVITVLGILVDDGIVVAENVYRLRSEGMDPKEAAIEGASSLMVPLLATLLTTVFAFLPLILVNDINFLFIRQMPVVIIITLLASLVEVCLSLPAHLSHAGKVKNYENLESQKSLKWGDRFFIQFKKIYYKFLHRMLKFRYFVVIFFICLFVSSIFLYKDMGYSAFESKEIDEIQVRLKAPDGTDLDTMNKRVYNLEKMIVSTIGGIKNPVDKIVTTVGSSNIAPSDIDNNNPRKAGMSIYLEPYSKRKDHVTAAEIIDKLYSALVNDNYFYRWLMIPAIKTEPLVQSFIKEPTMNKFEDLREIFFQFKNPISNVKFGYKAWLKEYNKTHLKITNVSRYESFRQDIKDLMSFDKGFIRMSFREPSFGPKQADPIEINVVGNDDEKRENALKEFYNYLSTVPGITGLSEEKNDDSREIFLNLNIPLMDKLGVTAASVADAVKTAYLGSSVGTIDTPDESISIVVSLSDKDKRSISNIRAIPVPTKYGTVIPIGQLVKLELHQNKSSIMRRNGRRTSSLSSSLDTSITNVREVADLLNTKIPQIINKYPGINVKLEGEIADLDDTIGEASMIALIGLTGIFFTLLLIFRSVSQPLFVLSTIPFGIVGVLYAFVLHKQSLNFFGIVGIIGLLGVVVNDAIVMVSHINTLLRTKEKGTIFEIIAQGASERLRPIILTTVTTVAGLLPAVYGWAGSISLFRPLAMAMAYGLLFGTFITLFLVPSFYVIDNDLKRFVNKIVNSLSLLKEGMKKLIRGK